MSHTSTQSVTDDIHRLNFKTNRFLFYAVTPTQIIVRFSIHRDPVTLRLRN